MLQPKPLIRAVETSVLDPHSAAKKSDRLKGLFEGRSSVILFHPLDLPPKTSPTNPTSAKQLITALLSSKAALRTGCVLFAVYSSWHAERLLSPSLVLRHQDQGLLAKLAASFGGSKSIQNQGSNIGSQSPWRLSIPLAPRSNSQTNGSRLWSFTQERKDSEY